MRVQDIIGSPPVILTGIAIARLMPKRVGYWLARHAARIIAKRQTMLYRTLRDNLAHVVGPSVDDLALNAMTEEALYHAGCTYIDMFRLTAQDYEQGRVKIRYDEALWAEVRAAMAEGRGTFLVGGHTSNFDLMAQWLAAQGVEMQVLSLPNPDAGTRMINALRAQRKLIMTPIDSHALRLAIKRLRNGGVCTTGVDRPVPSEDEKVLFFGKPASMPTGHVRLALQTNARILVACCIQEPDGYYAVRMSSMMEMERTGNRHDDVYHNVRRVLAFVEEVIREAPQQWLMFVPVWPKDESSAADNAEERA